MPEYSIPNKNDETLADINYNLDSCQNELVKICEILEVLKYENETKFSDPKTLDDFMARLLNCMNCSLNLNSTILFMNLTRNHFNKLLRDKKAVSCMYERKHADEVLKENVKILSNFSYNLGHEMTSLKELIKIKFHLYSQNNNIDESEVVLEDD